MAAAPRSSMRVLGPSLTAITAGFAVLVATGCGQIGAKGASDKAGDEPAAGETAASADEAIDTTQADSTVLAVAAKKGQAQKKAQRKPVVQAAAAPYLAIRSISYNGNGCPGGSISSLVSSDNLAFTLIFSSFVVTLNQGQKAPQATRRCIVNVGLNLPQGWQMGLMTLDQRGYTDIPAGGQGKLDTTAAFQGGLGSKKYSTLMRGPFTNDFQARHEVRFQSLSWSKCSGQANLKLTLDATVKTKARAAAYLGVDSLDGELRNQVGIVWRKCKG